MERDFLGLLGSDKSWARTKALVYNQLFLFRRCMVGKESGFRSSDTDACVQLRSQWGCIQVA